MCHLSIAIDRSTHALAPLVDLIDASSFHLGAIRVVPFAWSNKADVHLSLGGGSKDELERLMRDALRQPAVHSTDPVPLVSWSEPEFAR